MGRCAFGRDFGRPWLPRVRVRTTVCVQVRHGLTLLLFAAAFFLPVPASAWVETRAKGLLSTVHVERDGKATVSHELTLDVRGGPFQKLELATSDEDAEPLPDARVKKLSNGLVLPLVVEKRADGVLGLEIDHERGVRTGTYVFVIRYRTDLGARHLLHRRASSVEIRWTGPRLDSGIDGARTVFVLPPSEHAPRLASIAADDPDPGFGVLVGAVRRTPQQDEIELLRSHVARGEPVVWRVEASAEALPIAGAPPVAAKAERVPSVSSTPVSRRRSWGWSLGALAAGVLLTLLIALKARLFARACAASGATARPLVRLPLWARAPLAGLALAAGIYSGAELDEPTAAGAALLLAMAFAALGAPERARAPRSPGRWLPLRDEDAFGRRLGKLPGAWLDSGTLRGFMLLLGASALLVGLAAHELGRSPYRSLLVLLSGGVLVPLFFTGRASELVRDRAAFAQSFLRRLAAPLRANAALKVVPWGRVPDACDEPDELRLLIQVRDACDGLTALEVALEPQRGLGGIVGAPFVIVRAKEHSRARAALPPGVVWTRGRRPEERVAILAPKLPTLGLTVALVERLVELLSVQRSSNAARSAGRSALTLKLGRVTSPAHAT